MSIEVTVEYAHREWNSYDHVVHIRNYQQLQAKVAELEEELLKTRLELLTSHGESEELLGRIAELEKENARLRTVPMKYRRMQFNAQLQDENNELRAQLAAAQVECEFQRNAHKQAEELMLEQSKQLAAEQLNNKRLRDALEYVAATGLLIGQYVIHEKAHSVVRKALSQPSDTSALDSFVAERVKEYQERLANALAVLGADSQIEAEAVMLNYKKQVSTLTKQRDLAIEALEEVRRSGDTRLASMAIAQLTARVRDQGEIGYRQPAPKHSTLM